MRKLVLGFDIGGTKCAVILAEVRQTIHILRRESLETHAKEGFEQTWKRLLDCADSILCESNLEASALAAIGVSCGGPLDSKNGVVLCPPNLPGWVNIPVTQMLEEKYGVPACLQNDAKACALVEWALGTGQNCPNMLFLTMGTGFGCGVIANGALLTGTNDMCGEVGHIRLAETGPVGFGKEGSMEGFCSGGGIGRFMQMETQRLTEEGITPGWVQDGVPEDQYSAALLMRYAERHDAEALRLWDKIGENLGRALAVLIDAFNPERIVIGSIFVRCEHLLRPGMERILEREALEFSRKACAIVPAATGEQLGDLASIMAACYAQGLMPAKAVLNEASNRHFESLFARYPALAPQREAVREAYALLYDCYMRGGKLLVCGNGGSAADAEHIVGELMKGFFLKRPVKDAEKRAVLRALGEDGLCLQQPLPAISLTQHTALSTAFANDVKPAYIFAQQVLGYGRRGDVLLAISTSGNSDNVVKAARLAGALGLRTIAMTGPRAGLLGDICECVITCPGLNTAEVQEATLPVYHTLCAMLEAAFFTD